MMTCPTCSEPIDACRFPITHSHPTVSNVKLPGRVAKMMNRLDAEGKSYPSDLTLQEKDVLQNTRVHDNDYSTDVETSNWN